jgi:hypothetical protein
MSDFGEIVELRRKYFTEPYPADSIVEVSSLYTPTAKIEIEAVAIFLRKRYANATTAHLNGDPQRVSIAATPANPTPAPSQSSAQTGMETLLGTDGIAEPFLGNVMEIAIVTADAQRTMEGLCRMGIGPWQVHTFTPENTTNQTYRGNPSPFTMKVCFAPLGSIICEPIEPIGGILLKSS